jgi:hypothetical protein
MLKCGNVGHMKKDNRAKNINKSKGFDDALSSGGGANSMQRSKLGRKSVSSG